MPATANTMEILTFSKEVENQMSEKLKSLHSQSDASGISKEGIAAKSLSIIGDAVSALRQFVYEYKFKAIDEEIKFFKEVKPVFVSQYLFHKELHSISLVDPYMDKEEKKKYFYSRLKRVLRHTRRQATFHQYTFSGDTSKDEIYYTRTRMRPQPMRDSLFSTERSETLAVILSHALIREYLTTAIQKLDSYSVYQSKLNWTGRKTDLVELLFALHSTGSFNNGNAEVKEIALVFEHAFNIHLGNHYDYLQKMRTRKSGQIAFIEKLKTSLRTRLDTLDGAT
jgi:hypothetical protein